MSANLPYAPKWQFQPNSTDAGRPLSTKAKPIKVAIVGGGCASLCTAFELSRPHLADQYEITVYQQGWRLGGKGASGRGVANRIEEHGLHLWMGFYENAFRLMRESYAERHSKHPDLRFAQWHEAFSPAPNVGVTNTSQDGWDFWLAHFPAIAGEPGDPNNPETLSVATYLRHTVTLLGELLQSAFRGREPTQPSGEANTSFSTFETLVSNADRAIKAGQFAGLTATVELWQLLRAATLQFFPDAYGGEAMLPIRLVDQLTQLVEQHAETIAAQDQDLEKVWHVIDLVLACLKGTIRHGLVYDPRGFDAINDYDWRDWLQENGASKAALDSGFMRGIYDLTFAYEDGDVERPRLAAGVALRGALRMFFTYRGSLFWKMNGGMGDIVFAPLYQVLKDRGVRFKFFHRLTNVELGQTDTVETLHFDIQAKTKKGRYEPLINIHQMPSWPAQPDYSQLKKGAELERRGINFEASWEDHSAAKRALKVGDDFDAVVLGVSVGALPSVAPELIERSSRWKTMVANVKTVATQAFQTWMSASTEELGWSVAGANISGYVEPFDTWADMSHLIPEESWRHQSPTSAACCQITPRHPATNKQSGNTKPLGITQFSSYNVMHLCFGLSG